MNEGVNIFTPITKLSRFISFLKSYPAKLSVQSQVSGKFSRTEFPRAVERPDFNGGALKALKLSASANSRIVQWAKHTSFKFLNTGGIMIYRDEARYENAFWTPMINVNKKESIFSIRHIHDAQP